MSLLDRFFPSTSKAPQPTTGRVFSALQNQAAPTMHGEDYLDAYASSGWVFTAVDRTAEACADVPIRLERKRGDQWQEVDDHIAITTLKDANPLDTDLDLLIATYSYRRLIGESFWFVANGAATKKPKELYPLDPTRIKVAKSSIGAVTGYVYRNDAGEDIPLGPKEIIHHRRFNPRNRYRGMGPLQAAAIAVDTDTYAGQYNRNFFYNSATPSSVLETEGTLSDEQYKRLRAQWEEKYQGVDNAHKTAILEAGLTYKPTSLTQRDMEFLESRRFSRDEILGIMGVPKSIAGVTEDVNLANAKIHEYIFAKYTVRPEVRAFVARLNEFYLPLFDLDRREYRFNFEDPVPADVELELKRRENGIRNGWLLINEIREDEGLPEVEGGDVPLVATTMQPLSQTIEPPQPAPNHPPQEPAEPQKTVTKSSAQPIELRLAELADAQDQLEADTVALFAQQRDQLLKNLRARSAKTDELDKDRLLDKLFAGWEEWDTKLAELIAGVVSSIFHFSAERTALTVSLSAGFDAAHPRVTDWLATRGLESAKSVNGHVKEEVRKRLIQGVERGDSIKQIASSIEEFYGDQAEWRAHRLARTEVKDAYAQGSLEAARQAKVTEKKWLTAGPGEPDECRTNEAQGWIPLEAPFISGKLAPTQHPNCKCDLVYRHSE